MMQPQYTASVTQVTQSPARPLTRNLRPRALERRQGHASLVSGLHSKHCLALRACTSARGSSPTVLRSLRTTTETQDPPIYAHGAAVARQA